MDQQQVERTVRLVYDYAKRHCSIGLNKSYFQCVLKGMIGAMID
jgi:hypothetical protein